MTQRKWILPLAWAVVIFITSSTVLPSRTFVHAVATAAPGAITEDSFRLFWRHWWWLFVKGYHALEFGILALLLRRWLAAHPIWVPALAAACYAATDELHQILVPERGARFTDWVIDCAGIAAALLLALVIQSRQKHER